MHNFDLPEDGGVAHAQFGCLNFRDISWVNKFDHRVQATGKVYRSDCLSWCSADDLGNMRKRLGIRSLIDLRSPVEAEANAVTEAASNDLRYVNIPVVGEPELSSAVAMARAGQRISEGYLKLLVAGKEGIRQVFQWMADDKAREPVVIFCAAGKDRTGIVAALLLANAGVSTEAIAADYAESSRTLDAQRRRSGQTWSQIEQIPAAARSCSASTMLDVLSSINERWGSVPSYLASIGIGSGTREKMRMLLTEPVDHCP